MTTRGFGETEMREVGRLIAQVLNDVKSPETLEKVREGVAALTKKHPLYAWKN